MTRDDNGGYQKAISYGNITNPDPNNPFGCDDPDNCYTHTAEAIEARRKELETAIELVGAAPVKAPPFKIDGIDYTREGIEEIRKTLGIVRDRSMKDADWHAVAFTSHVIALLAYLIELEEFTR